MVEFATYISVCVCYCFLKNQNRFVEALVKAEPPHQPAVITRAIELLAADMSTSVRACLLVLFSF